MSDIATAVNGALLAGRTAYKQAYLRDVATVLGRNVTQEADGSHATDFKPKPLQLRCRLLTSDDGAEVESGKQIISTMSFEVRFPVGSDIRDTDKLQIKGVTYSVIALDSDRSDALFLSATCVRVK